MITKNKNFRLYWYHCPACGWRGTMRSFYRVRFIRCGRCREYAWLGNRITRRGPVELKP